MNAANFRRGFTLIELLVVVTIIGLLAALLFPVFAKARERARQTTCESNLHQIGLAIQMYQSDNGGRLPVSFYDVSSIAPADQLKLDPLQPYEHSADIYHCPDAQYHVGGSHGPLGDAYLDYNSRIQELLECSKASQFRSSIPGGLLRPEPLSVLVYDAQHINIEQSFIVLRENGAVSRVPSSKTVFWQYLNGNWQPMQTGTSFRGNPPWSIFPDEPWPPQFEK